MDIKKNLLNLWDGNKGDYQKITSVEFNDIGMRGVKNLKVNFNFPITAIAGANGIGKTTILQTIACLFHNKDERFHPYRFTNAKNKTPNYRFTDFFIILRGEDKGLKAKIDFTFKRPGQVKESFSVNKKLRWSNYDRRPERYVDFLGISRVLPAHESAVFLKEFSGNSSLSKKQQLSKKDKNHVSTITGKNLNNVTEESSNKVTNFKLGKITSKEGLEYSSFNMGAGEEVAITLISRLSTLPKGSLVLIEEIELGLHPKAQKELIKSLLNIVFEKRIQLIFTTHSPYIFNELPQKAKILLKKSSSILEAIYSPSNSLAFIELSGENLKDLTIYVEDNVAKQLVQNLFNSTVSKRIHIIDVGSKENVVRMTSSHYINANLGDAIGIGDGDLKDSEIHTWCRNYMHKNSVSLDSNALNEKRKQFFTTLPSNSSPEKYIFQKIQNDDCFINYIDDSEEFSNFIKNKIMSDDIHDIFYTISQEISKEENAIKTIILNYTSKNYKEEFNDIIHLVNSKLNLTS